MLAKIIITNNKEKNLGWHINNLINMKFALSENIIKRLGCEIKESYFHKEDEFLKNIN